MLIVAKKKTIPWPVKVSLPQDGGKYKEFPFTVVFRCLDDDEIADLDAKVEAAPESDRPATRYDGWIVSWSSVQDEDKQEIPYSKDVLAGLLSGSTAIPFIVGLSTALNEIRTGARAKN